MKLVEAIENSRRTTQLQIRRPLGTFEDGMFEVYGPEIRAVAFCWNDFPGGTLSANAATLTKPPIINNVYGKPVSWTAEVLEKITLWIAR